MGGRSRSGNSSSSTSGSGTSTGQVGKTSNGDAVKLQQGFRDEQMGFFGPIFGALMDQGTGSGDSNFMKQAMGAALGMPIQVQTPDKMSAFFDKYRPKEEEQQQPQPAPQFNINDHMRQLMNPGQNQNPYGVNPNMNYGGQYGPGNQGQY